MTSSPPGDSGWTFSDVGHGVLDVAGLVPGFGEAADLANAAWYAGDGQYLEAGLSAISMVPVVGDIIGKGGKLIGKLGPEAAAQLFKLVKGMDFAKALAPLKANKTLAPYVDEMVAALEKWRGDLLPCGKKALSLGDVKAIPKGSRPDPSTYLSPKALAEHKQAFSKGGSRMVLASNLKKYGIAQRDGTAFMKTSKEMDELIAKTGGDKRKLEEALGLPAGQLDGDELIRVDIAPDAVEFKVPSGNEAGANDLWLPGGRLPDGSREAIVDMSKVRPGSIKLTPMGGG